MRRVTRPFLSMRRGWDQTTFKQCAPSLAIAATNRQIRMSIQRQKNQTKMRAIPLYTSAEIEKYAVSYGITAAKKAF